jgi:phosphohistidine phosphatase
LINQQSEILNQQSMKTLLILRHAKSSWKEAELADHDRPLNKRGKRDAPRIGKLVRQEDLVPDLILSSTAKRAHKTSEAVAEESGYRGEVQLIPELYAAPPEAYLEAVKGLRDEYSRVMVVGHNRAWRSWSRPLPGNGEPADGAAQVALPSRRWQDLDDETEGETGESVDAWESGE